MARLFVFGKKVVESMNPITVHDVAKYFLSCVDDSSGSSITHLKLQKLCYYSQAWHMVFENVPIFNEHFEAWVHGPACPELWHFFKEHGRRDIPPVEGFDASIFTGEQLETLDAVWEAYGQYDGKYLEELTHQERPWIDARKGYAPGDHCTNIITLKSMREYYSSLLDENE